MNEIKISDNLSIKSIDDLARISKLMASSGFFQDSRDAAQCAVKILAGMEMGISPFAAMSGIFIIQGKPCLSANIMASRIKASMRYDYKIIVHTEDICKLNLFENGKLIGESSFTMDDAVKAECSTGKNQATWRKYPRNMLFARAISNAFRWHFSDLAGGSNIYTPEELDVVVDEEGAPITLNHSVKVVDKPENYVKEEHSECIEVENNLVIENISIEDKINDFVIEMGLQTSTHDLKRVYQRAYKYASTLEDPEYIKNLTEIKDFKKSLLEEENVKD